MFNVRNDGWVENMIRQKQRRTNVIWSFESHCLHPALVDTMLTEEVDGLRLVPDADEWDRALMFISTLQQATRKKGVVIPVMVDLFVTARGCVGSLKEPKEVAFEQKITFGRKDGQGDFKVDSEDWDNLFMVGAPVYLGNGAVVVNPTEVGKDKVTCEVVQGGSIFPDMEIHVPRTARPKKFADINLKNLDALIAHEVDAIIVPAFESEDDLHKLTDYLQKKAANPPWLILKVASESEYRNLKVSLPFVRGILISRVEIAMTLDPARVPMITKEMIQLCNDRAKLVMVASEIMASMRYNATPTRAEVSDIANAVIDGADAVILSEELPHGDYALRGLILAKKAVEEVESVESRYKVNWIKHSPEITDELEAITYNAYQTAQRNHAKAIVCITKQGNTALLLSAFRTATPIIAVTMSEQVYRQMALMRGVSAIMLDEMPNIDQVLPIINDRLVNESWLRAGDKIVFVSVTLSSIGSTASNLFTIQTLR